MKCYEVFMAHTMDAQEHTHGKIKQGTDGGGDGEKEKQKT